MSERVISLSDHTWSRVQVYGPGSCPAARVAPSGAADAPDLVQQRLTREHLLSQGDVWAVGVIAYLLL